MAAPPPRLGRYAPGVTPPSPKRQVRKPRKPPALKVSLSPPGLINR
jgi:hypothetical protein